MRASSPATRQRIIETSASLLSSHGCEGTTIEDIITAAGVSKGAFFHYFKNKEHLAEVLVELAHGQYQDLVNSLPADAQPIERLRAMLETLAGLNASGQWVNCRLMLRLLAEPHAESSNIHHALDAFWQWYRAFYKDLIIKCRQAGQLSSNTDPDLQTYFLLSMLAGLCLLNQFDPATPPLSEMVEQIIKSL